MLLDRASHDVSEEGSESNADGGLLFIRPAILTPPAQRLSHACQLAAGMSFYGLALLHKQMESNRASRGDLQDSVSGEMVHAQRMTSTAKTDPNYWLSLSFLTLSTLCGRCSCPKIRCTEIASRGAKGRHKGSNAVERSEDPSTVGRWETGFQHSIDPICGVASL